MKIKNPILPGFHPDPSICRRGEDYYLAVSSFEWFPGIPVYHSTDLKNWELISHGLTEEKTADLRRLPSAKGIWAPDLSWCEEEGRFYLLFSVMNSMNARFFDVDNFCMTAPEITGPWSDPVYIHSAGFDPSILHDEDGRKYVVSLEWETRAGYHKPGEICVVEYDAKKEHIVGLPRRIWLGGTRRGCIEGPHIYKRNGWYYLMCAEGGTGYGHCVTMARSRNIFGPYNSDPKNPILTSTPDFDEMDNDDSRKLNRYNPDSILQKSGHGSLADTCLGETYLVHHCGKPYLPELRCVLGRETCMQKMEWTKDGWLRLAGGGNTAKEEFEASALPPTPFPPEPQEETFEGGGFRMPLYSPRCSPKAFAGPSGYGSLYLRGQESLSSLNRVSLLAHKLTSLNAEAVVKLDFTPECYQQHAGICTYYDNMDYAALRKTWSEKCGGEVLDVIRVRNGVYTEAMGEAVPAPGGSVWLRVRAEGADTRFSWSEDGESFREIGPVFDTTEFSDEFCEAGEFTGTFLGFFCVDAMLHEKAAYIDKFIYRSEE